MDDITDTDFRLLLADIQHMTWTAQLAHMVLNTLLSTISPIIAHFIFSRLKSLF